MKPRAKGTEENTSDGMAKGGHFLLTSGGTTAKVFNRSVSCIDVKSGAVTVVSAEQKQKIIDIENATEYPDWAAVSLGVGIHIVDFRKCELSGATGVTQVNYGV